MRYILIILLFLSFHSFGQVGQRTDSMPSDSARIPITEPRRYWIDSQGRYWNSFYLSMDSLRAWGNRQGWGSGGGISFSDTISTIATKYDLDTLTVSGGGVQYSDSITTFTTPTQVHDSVKNKLDSSTVLLNGGWGFKQGVLPLSYVAGDSIIVDSSKVATVYDASLKLDKADTATMLAPYMLYTDTSGILTNYLIYGDTSSMLSPYLRTANQIDTTSLSNRINLKVSIADTSSMLSPYLRTENATTGTVISIATSTGITGGTITTSGTLKADTSLLATQYFVNNTDSVGTIVRGTWNGTTIAINKGGTGATADSTARSNLGARTTIDTYRKIGSPLKTQSIDFPAHRIATAAAIASGVEYIMALEQVADTVTGLTWWQSNAPTFNAGTNNRIGLMRDSAGTYKLVASSANDTAMFEGGSTLTYRSKDFTSQYVCSKDTVYYGVLLYTSTSGTGPTIGSFSLVGAAASAPRSTLSRAINAAATSKTDLDNSVAASSAPAVNIQLWMGIY